MTLGIICGFKAEEKLARRLSPLTACAWRHPQAAAALIARGATALLSFGLAGGLSPTLRTGQVLLPRTVDTAAGSCEVDPAWHARLVALFPAAATGPLYASDAVITSPAAKHALHQQTAAVAVDMESGEVARAARAAGIPFAVLRAVSDPHDRALPPAALVALVHRGGLAVGALLGSLLRQPAQIAQLLRTGRDSRMAMRVLAGCIEVLGQT